MDIFTEKLAHIRDLTIVKVAFAPVADDIQTLLKAIPEYIPSETVVAKKMVHHLFSNPGKMIRPALYLLCCKLVDYSGPHKIAMAAVTEFVHNASLLHDDVIDNSTLRRNKPTANSIWGDESAILFGDLIYARASEMMAETSNLKVVASFARAIRIMSETELLQLEHNFNFNIEEATYLRILYGKTAVLIGTACQCAGLLADSSAAQLHGLNEFGLKIGIDFKGGALTEVTYTTMRPEQSVLNKDLEALNFGSMLLQPTGALGYIVKSRELADAEHSLLLKTLSQGDKSPLIEVGFNSIGPSVGRELTKKAIIAIICFIAFAFRKVSRPISSWKYGFIAIVTLLHDVAIPVGLFVILSHYYGAELDTLFVVAVLTILGLSVSDTIVIFDRIRENLRSQNNIAKANFSEIVGKSLEQSFVRSICTSLTVILVLLALVFVGPASTKYFALMLSAGMFFGTYSSIFLASPLLIMVEEWQKRKVIIK